MSTPQSAIIVDDEQHIRLFVKMILKEMGIENTREAKNGKEALELYGQEKADIILMDVNMAGMGGVETLDQFKQQYPEAAIIMLTSTATREVVEECIEHGARNYIRKDTPKEEIIKILTDTFETLND